MDQYSQYLDREKLNVLKRDIILSPLTAKEMEKSWTLSRHGGCCGSTGGRESPYCRRGFSSQRNFAKEKTKGRQLQKKIRRDKQMHLFLKKKITKMMDASLVSILPARVSSQLVFQQKREILHKEENCQAKESRKRQANAPTN